MEYIGKRSCSEMKCAECLISYYSVSVLAFYMIVFPFPSSHHQVIVNLLFYADIYDEPWSRLWPSMPPTCCRNQRQKVLSAIFARCYVTDCILVLSLEQILFSYISKLLKKNFFFSEDKPTSCSSIWIDASNRCLQ